MSVSTWWVLPGPRGSSVRGAQPGHPEAQRPSGRGLLRGLRSTDFRRNSWRPKQFTFFQKTCFRFQLCLFLVSLRRLHTLVFHRHKFRATGEGAARCQLPPRGDITLPVVLCLQMLQSFLFLFLFFPFFYNRRKHDQIPTWPEGLCCALLS